MTTESTWMFAVVNNATGRRPRRRAAAHIKRLNVRSLYLRPPERLDEHERDALRQALAKEAEAQSVTIRNPAN
jgi:hypothetical protein